MAHAAETARRGLLDDKACAAQPRQLLPRRLNLGVQPLELGGLLGGAVLPRGARRVEPLHLARQPLIVLARRMQLGERCALVDRLERLVSGAAALWGGPSDSGAEIGRAHV